MDLDKEPHYCIVCEKLTENHGDSLSNVNDFQMGYGSRLDCDVYQVTICDDCMEEKTKDGIVKYLYNQFDPEKTKERFIKSLTPDDEEYKEYHPQTEQPKSEGMKLMDKYLYMEVDDNGKVISQSPLVDIIFGENDGK